MDLNDGGLSPREHAEMRDTVLAGTQRIRPAGTHRAQLIAGAVALVLIGGITGGAVTTAALLDSADQTAPVSTSSPSPTPRQTSTPSPTPSASPTPDPGAVIAFGGDCGAVLSDAEAATATGKAMSPLAAAWSPGADEKLGGLSCGWTTSDEYMGAEVRVSAYPAEIAQAASAVSPDACQTQGSSVDCSLSGMSGDLWLSVAVTRTAFDGTAIDIDAVRAATEEVLSLAVTRADGFPAPRPAARTDDWWTIDSCSAIGAELEAAGAVPPGSVVSDALDELDDSAVGVVPVRLGVSRWCAFDQGRFFLLWPGGADTFPTVAALDASEPLEIPGAAGAVLAPSLDAYEGHHPLAVVTDGVNMLAVLVDGSENVQDTDIAFTTALLAVMAGR